MSEDYSMHNVQQVTENENKTRKESVIMKTAIGGNFGAKFTFTIGSTYLGFALLGMINGIFFAKKPSFNLPTKRLLISYYINSVSQNSLRYANGAASAAMLYCLMGWGLNSLFEDEMANLSPFQTNLMVGLLTGGLYKSSLGLTPMIVGGVTGMALSGGINLIIDELRERDYVSFEMRFN